tara:strand:- start:326836 stop:327912 length:1077 start_codon:yes stop_codon:yes gene_type:complete
MDNLVKDRIKKSGLYNNNLLEKYNPDIIQYVKSFSSIDIESLSVYSNSTNYFFKGFNESQCQGILNLSLINGFKYINKYFEDVNKALVPEGTFIGCFESKNTRQKKQINDWGKHLGKVVNFIDFLVHRVLPKVKLTKKIYFYLYKKGNRVVTSSEMLGRLYSCGFKVVGHETINGTTYFVALKDGVPNFDHSPTYGPLITLNRVGYKGQKIKVYKFRTMHPYSEYLQKYIYEQNDLNVGGKFKDDFRITAWGAFMRKVWLDELPMIYNWLKREMKLVGVRPISSHYLSLYPEDFAEIRKNYKPGLIPPFYADLPDTFEEIVNSEKKYIESYEKNPILTDIKYFFKSLNNIFIKRARSK